MSVIDPRLVPLAESFVDETLQVLPADMQGLLQFQRKVLVDRLAAAMQLAVLDELTAFQRDLATGLRIADAIISMEGK